MIAEGNFDEGRRGPAGAVRGLRVSAVDGVVAARRMGANGKRVGWAWLPKYSRMPHMQPMRVRLWPNIALQGRPARALSCHAALALPAVFLCLIVPHGGKIHGSKRARFGEQVILDESSRAALWRD
jgi:hypothetical protein